MKKIVLFLLTLSVIHAFAQNLIPKPKKITYLSDNYSVIKNTDCKIDSGLKLPEEGYTLDIKNGRAILKSKTSQGMVWAKSTLKQLEREDGKYPEVHIVDYPAFPIRGFMHDTGRNFRPISLLKKDLDLLSLYKINVFHWHLTDNPAWRIECKSYPELNDSKNQTKGRNEGKFYTYKEIHELISYAKEKGIMIIPEIDMPGHSQYFHTTFGFPMSSEKGMKVLEKCLNEFFEEISVEECPYFHIGSDEIHIDNAREFMAFCEKIVTDNGRIPICWNPGLPPSPNTVTQIWNASISAELKDGRYPNPYIDSYMGYLNNNDPLLNTTYYYLHQACNQDSSTMCAKGGILCLWNDVRVDNQNKLFNFNGMPNGLLAFSESFWHGGNTKEKNISEFEKRLSYHRDKWLYEYDMRWVANSHLKWKVTIPQARGTSINKMKWTSINGGVVDLSKVCIDNNVKVLPSMDAWITTEWYFPVDTIVDVWIGFDIPSRANRKSAGIGYQGHWESDGRVFINDEEIFPEPWKEPGKYCYNWDTWFTAENEIPFTEEQFYFLRKPAKIRFKSGYNKIMLYCPKTMPKKEWSVAFIPIHLDKNGHVSELKFLTESPCSVEQGSLKK